jgi:Cof subfamily protein (haloacid dehalogenase superfamily)
MSTPTTTTSRPFPTPSDVTLIVADVDGTLLDSQHTLPESSPTHVALRRIRASHPELPIVLSTGKQHANTAGLRAQLDLHRFPSCHLNGNLIYNPDGSLLFENYLPPGLVRRVYALLSREEEEEEGGAGVGVFCYDHERVFQLVGSEEGDGWAATLRGYGEDVVVLSAPGATSAAAEEFLARVDRAEVKVVKMAVCQVEAQIAGIRRRLVLEGGGGFAVTQALTFCLELIPPGQDKGVALETLLKRLAVRREGVLAFGDGENDVSMFDVAGMPVAMGNAMDCAKQRAAWVTASNDEGGVGRFLERVFWPAEN